MASSNTTTKKCATCIQNSDEQKVKPGIALCEGCDETYCLSHFVEHRQTLNNKLDDIAGQRDILRSHIEELPTRMSNEHLKTIDDWENTMLQTVTEAAKTARQQVRRSVINEMERECSELTSKITTFRVNDNCFETDLKALQAIIEKLNEELNDSPGLHRIQLNLPTLDCSNMIHTRSSTTYLLAEVANSNDSTMLKPTEEYRSFAERFLTTNQPSTDLPTKAFGYICASPTMLINVVGSQITRFVFHRQSTSKFPWEYWSTLDIRWSTWLQQFIVLTCQTIVAIDAVEKENKQVVEMKLPQVQYMSHWKDLCFVADNTNRVYCYQMNKNLADWLLLYCWSTPTTCASHEKITAIALNEDHIVLSIQCNDQHRFAIHKRDMTHCSNIQLTRPCTTIQALPQGEWLLYNSSEQFYYVIDSELEQQDEPYLSSLKDSELTISCDETDKVFLALLPRRRVIDYERGTSGRIRVYTNNCLL